MSYILDALRKADAQRERDPARGIHAQPGRGTIGPQPQRTSPAPWIAVAALVGLAAGGWYLFRGAPAPTNATQGAAAQSQAVPVATAPPPAAPSVPAPVLAQAVMPPPVVVAPPMVAAAPPAGVPDRAARMGGRPQLAQPASAASPAPTASQAPAASSAPAAAGLPPDAPKLAITGGVYSAAKAQRMLIVNGQVAMEGADLGSGVTLEEIKPKSAVLRFRGARYSVTY